MPKTKHFLDRLLAIDEVLSNARENEYILLSVLLEELKGKFNVSERTLRNDLKYIKSFVEIQCVRNKGYRYANLNKTIKNSLIYKNELNMVMDVLSLILKFDGVMNAQVIQELFDREELKNHLKTMGLNRQTKPVIIFDQNLQLQGLDEWLSPLLDAVTNNMCVKIRYQPFGKENASESFVYPYLLKQYNNRWFLIGKKEDDERVLNFAIDRINSVEMTRPMVGDELKKPNLDEHFKHVVGVSVPKEGCRDVVFRTDNRTYNYIRTKPLHNSQKIERIDDCTWEVRLRVKINYELRALLRSFGDAIEVIEPKELRREMHEMAVRTAEKHR